MEKQYNLLIDTKRTGFNSVRGIKQGDNNSVLNITLVQNSIPFNLENCTVRINYKRSDNKIFLQMADITNATEGKIKINVLTQVLENVGEVKADLSIFDSNNRKITSVTFSIFVDASIYRNDYIEPEDLDLIQSIWVEEDKRIKQENTRVEAEKIRVVQETTRVSNEDARVQVEKERVETEKNRISNEDIRKSNETNRDDAEKIRQANEITRQGNEDTRVKNESERLNNEKIREAQETTRQQEYINMQNTIDDFSICEAYDSTKDYKKFNRVTFNGNSYEAIKDVPKGIEPTNVTYWICIAEKGKDGLGTGDMHTNIYDKNNNGIVDKAESITDGIVTYTATDINTRFNNIISNTTKLNANDMEARKEIIDIKLALKEKLAIDFINKTGIGFYDTFENTEYVDTSKTTATHNNVGKSMDFKDNQILAMKPQEFNKFTNIDMQVVAGKLNKVIVKDTTNSNTINISKSDRQIVTGDKLFINNKPEEITDVQGLASTHEVKDATVINQPYSTAGNGGRKLVRLDNGWLVCCLQDGRDVSGGGNALYISKDCGNTWTLLKNISEYCKYNTIVAHGNTIYMLITSSITTNVGYYQLDVPNTISGGYISMATIVDRNQTAIDNCSITINKEGTELHACWSSKNATYPNSFNIRYAKGTIQADGSVIWGSVEQVTKENNSIHQYTNPTILVRQDGTPLIIAQYYYNTTPSNYIIAFGDGLPGSGDSYSRKFNYIYDGGSYGQQNPSAIFVPQSINGLAQGRIWVAWHGTDSVDNSANNIRVSYSDDSGATWSTPEKLTNGTSNTSQSFASITANKNNEIFILFTGQLINGGVGVTRSIKCTNGVWGGIENITTNHCSYSSSLLDSSYLLNFSKPLFIHQDLTLSKVGFYGTWQEGSGYTITMKNPVTVQQGEQIPIVDFNVKQDTTPLTLTSMDGNKLNYTISSLDTTTASISIEGKDNTIESIAYAIG